MHIGIDARLTYYRMGGISTYIRRVVQALETLDTENRYTVFHSRKAKSSITSRFEHGKLWTPSHHRLERLALSVELLPHRLDIFHSTDFIPPYRGGKRHVINVYDLTFIHYPQYLTADSRRYYNDQIEAAVRHADHILVISEATKQDLIDILAVPQEKITVHMLAADESFIPLPEDTLAHYRTALDLPNTYILFVGTFEPRKNIPSLIKAYRTLKQQLPDAPPLVLAGHKGWLFDTIWGAIEDDLKHTSDILWRERIPQDAMPALYNMACALVLPSFYEGFGLPALEAMACGTAPIVSNCSSLPEVVGDVGALIEPNEPQTITDALYKAITDIRWRQEQERAGLQRASQFSWQQTAEIVLKTYRSVL